MYVTIPLSFGWSGYVGLGGVSSGLVVPEKLEPCIPDHLNANTAQQDPRRP